MASVQGLQSVLETTGIFGCPIPWKLETFSILNVKKESNTEINDASRNATSFLKSLFLNPFINQEKETKERKKQKTYECRFDTGHADTSAQSLASFG